MPKTVAVDTTAQGFRIRPGRRGDADTIAALLQELGYTEGADTTTVNWVISHPEMEIMVAAGPGDKPVGMATLSHRPQLRMRGRIATIDELIVTKAWRGKGVGRALLMRVVDRAKVLGAKRLELVTHEPRAELSRAFYEKCGFTEGDAVVFRYLSIDFQKR
jgi:GNAT superfamily N-acetyltransferase